MQIVSEALHSMMEKNQIFSSLKKENVSLQISEVGHRTACVFLKPDSHDTIYKFRIAVTSKNIEILASENNAFHSDPSLQKAFQIWIDFLLLFSEKSTANLFIYRHESKSKPFILSVFDTFFSPKGFQSFEIEEASAFQNANIIEKTAPCFIKELQPNILPKHIIKKEMLIEASMAFQKLEPTFKANTIKNISKLKYSFFGHKGVFHVSYDNGFYLQDEEIKIKIPFIKNTLSMEHAKEFLKRLEAKKKMEYIYESTAFPIAPVGVAYPLGKEMMSYLKKDYGLKELHLACLKKQFKKATFYGYKVITILDHIFIATTSSSNKTYKLFLHTKNKEEAERFLFEDAANKIKQAL